MAIGVQKYTHQSIEISSLPSARINPAAPTRRTMQGAPRVSRWALQSKFSITSGAMRIYGSQRQRDPPSPVPRRDMVLADLDRRTHLTDHPES